MKLQYVYVYSSGYYYLYNELPCRVHYMQYISRYYITADKNAVAIHLCHIVA